VNKRLDKYGLVSLNSGIMKQETIPLTYKHAMLYFAFGVAIALIYL
jgi:hypothetical protein